MTWWAGARASSFITSATFAASSFESLLLIKGTLTSRRKHDVFDVFLAHDARRDLHELSRMLGLKLFDMPLIAHLRPSAAAGVMDLVAGHRLGPDCPALSQYEDARRRLFAKTTAWMGC